MLQSFKGLLMVLEHRLACVLLKRVAYFRVTQACFCLDVLTRIVLGADTSAPAIFVVFLIEVPRCL